MPFTDVANNRSGQPAEAFMTRHLGTAAHPSARNAGVLVDLGSPYRPMETQPDAVYPRASVRPMSVRPGQRDWWAVKIWDGPKDPARKEGGGPWITNNLATLAEAMDWAATEVDARRPKVPSPC